MTPSWGERHVARIIAPAIGSTSRSNDTPGQHNTGPAVEGYIPSYPRDEHGPAPSQLPHDPNAGSSRVTPGGSVAVYGFRLADRPGGIERVAGVNVPNWQLVERGHDVAIERES